MITTWKPIGEHKNKNFKERVHETYIEEQIKGERNRENEIFRNKFIPREENFPKSKPSFKKTKMQLVIKPEIRSQFVKFGVQYKITCISKGSRPPAVITWYKNNKEIREKNDKVSDY